jgi:CheY-like chemotaxis protein
VRRDPGQPVPPPLDRDTAEARSRLRHDVNNSLAAIGAVAHLLRTDPDLPKSLHSRVDDLLAETARLRSLVEELGRSTAGPSFLPARAQPTKGPGATEPTPDVDGGPSPRPWRVLVLDDDAAIRAVLGRVLRRAGHVAVLATTGAEALDAIREEPPDVILCDHQMNGMSGLDFHAAAIRIAPGLAARFIFMTGDPGDPRLAEVARAARARVLAKPFEIAALPQLIASVVGDRRA